MKLSGLGKTKLSRINQSCFLSADKLTAHRGAGACQQLTGLSGQSYIIRTAGKQRVFKATPAVIMPFVHRRREYRVMCKMASAGLAVRPIALNQNGLLIPWTVGERLCPATWLQHRDAVVRLLSRLHHQPATGYRLLLTPLLLRYWQCCQQRRIQWLRLMQRCTARPEPKPLRLAPLHMDVTPENLLLTTQGLQLIDWEYAADGDVALELTALCAHDWQQAEGWIVLYAEMNNMRVKLLRHQVGCWRPWLNLLQACWYQLRAEQSQEPRMMAAAREAWYNAGQ